MRVDTKAWLVAPGSGDGAAGTDLIRFLEYVHGETDPSRLLEQAVSTLATGIDAHPASPCLLGRLPGPPPCEAGAGWPDGELERVVAHLRRRGLEDLGRARDRIAFVPVADPAEWLPLALYGRHRFTTGLVAVLPGARGDEGLLAAFAQGCGLKPGDEALFRAVAHGLSLALRQGCDGRLARVPRRPGGARLSARRHHAQVGDAPDSEPDRGPGLGLAAVCGEGQLTENTLTGIYLQRGEIIVECNEVFAAIFGYRKAELRGTSLRRLIVTDPAVDRGSPPSLDQCHKLLRAEVAQGINRRGQPLWLRAQTWDVEHLGERMLLGNVIDITSEIRGEIALRRSEMELRALSDELIGAQEKERKRIARELHDGLQQQLSAIKFSVESAVAEMDAICQDRYAERFQQVLERAQRAVDEVRRISMDLRPSMLDDLGIAATISWFCREFQTMYPGIEVISEVDIREGDLPDNLKVVVFRILQEACNNIAKHAQAQTARIWLRDDRGRVRLCIADDGVGFALQDCPADRRGFGLNSMRERARLSGGRLRICSRARSGTLLMGIWPTVD
jgi:PAS domain S-box-containing protein